jgi:hypothetical protein
MHINAGYALRANSLTALLGLPSMSAFISLLGAKQHSPCRVHRSDLCTRMAGANVSRRM